MLLALDVGNTHTGVGCFIDNQLKHQWRLSTHPLCTADELRSKLKMILSHSGVHLEDASAIVVSSVVPAFTRLIQATFKSTFQSAFKPERFLVIDPTWPFSFDIAIDSPEEVGTDRIVNAEAAVREYGAPCIIVDSGTATTICAIAHPDKTRKPQYLGGAIFAGIELSMQALARNTARLFTVELTPPSRVIGSNTREALQSGLLFGYASMIDGMVERFRKEIFQDSLSEAQDLPVICTGGISALMKGLTSQINRFDADLTLKGIAYLHESFSKRKS